MRPYSCTAALAWCLAGARLAHGYALDRSCLQWAAKVGKNQLFEDSMAEAQRGFQLAAQNIRAPRSWDDTAERLWGAKDIIDPHNPGYFLPEAVSPQIIATVADNYNTMHQQSWWGRIESHSIQSEAIYPAESQSRRETIVDLATNRLTFFCDSDSFLAQEGAPGTNNERSWFHTETHTSITNGPQHQGNLFADICDDDISKIFAFTWRGNGGVGVLICTQNIKAESVSTLSEVIASLPPQITAPHPMSTLLDDQFAMTIIHELYHVTFGHTANPETGIPEAFGFEETFQASLRQNIANPESYAIYAAVHTSGSSETYSRGTFHPYHIDRSVENWTGRIGQLLKRDVRAIDGREINSKLISTLNQ